MEYTIYERVETYPRKLAFPPDRLDLATYEVEQGLIKPTGETVEAQPIRLPIPGASCLNDGDGCADYIPYNGDMVLIAY